VGYSRRSMEGSVEVILHPARWSVRPSGMVLLANCPPGCGRASKVLRSMPVPRKADTHTSSGSTNDSALLAIRHMGVDILGPFPRAVGGYRYIFVAIDKFTKWPEATPVVSITQSTAVTFLKLIVCRFGVPSRIITDNGTQFTSRVFQEYCEGIGTRLCFASVAHPRSNGQVERANADILRGLKTRTYDCLKKHGANWVNELPSVLWGTEPHPAEPPGRHHSSWSMGPKPAFPENHYGLPTGPVI
jgi:transposase InsO family protein